MSAHGKVASKEDPQGSRSSAIMDSAIVVNKTDARAKAFTHTLLGHIT